MKKPIRLFMIVVLIIFILSGYVYSENGGRECNIMAFMENQSAGAPWLTYALTRCLWYGSKFYEEFPSEDNYYLTFDEELAAREALVKTWIELSEQDSSLSDKYLKDLVLVYEAGYLREYTFLNFNDGGWMLDTSFRIVDFLDWAAENIPNHNPGTLVVIE